MNKLLITLFFSAALLAGCQTASDSDARVRFVDEFDLSHASCGFGKTVKPRTSVDGHPITLLGSGKTYARGIGTHPESGVAFALNGKVAAFDAVVGLDADAKTACPRPNPYRLAAEFKVWADGKVAWTSGPVEENGKPVTCHVDLAGVREVVLETTTCAPWRDFDAVNADWADARFSLGACGCVALDDDPALFTQLGVLTPPEKDEPQFNGADIWGVRPGHPVIFRVPVSGARPMRFRAEGLPKGVTFDAAKGILGGVAPAAAGSYDIRVTAENAKGRAARTIRLEVGDTIALTPPMGWNSWNVWCYRLTADHVRASARALEESGLGNHGWAYVNLDDWWMMNTSGCARVEQRRKDFGGREDVIGPARDAKGRILPNRSFPDMKGLTDYIHSFGFKAGLYSSPGAMTCGRCEGSLGHEREDAESWADWGFDYVKYDWCFYNEVFRRETKGWDLRHTAAHATPEKPYPGDEAFAKPYRLMSRHLKAQKRDILHSFCQYGVGNVHLWARDAGANCWRSWDDLKDGWTWMEMAVDSRVNGEFWKYTGPGCWADPDMMIVGRQYSFGTDHPSYLTPNEQYTHVSLWAMIASPMLIGCDLTKLDAFTRSLLANDEVIAISQDRLGKPARRIRHVDGESVWVRPLANGDTAVALVNRSPVTRTVRVTLGELGLSGDQAVRDTWCQRDEEVATEDYAARIPPHATKLVRLTSAPCRKCR